MTSQAGFTTGMMLSVLSIFIFLFIDKKNNDHELEEKNLTLFQLLYSKKYLMELMLFLSSFSIFQLLSRKTYTPYNNYSYLAEAWLNGRLDSPDLPDYLESIQFGGKTYVHFAPGAAILCLPFVLIFGLQGINNIFLCNLIGSLNCALCWCVLSERHAGKRFERIWMTVFLIFGTVHLWCSSWGTSWLLGHLSALFFLLLSLSFLFRNTFKKYNDFVSGIFFGLAVCCRLSNLLGGIFFIGYLFLSREKKIKSVLRFTAGAAVFGSLYMLYNYARFGTIMDISYQLTYLKDYHRSAYDLLQSAPYWQQLDLLSQYTSEYGGPLQLRFVISNLKSLFLQLPSISSSFPWVIPEIYGVCITLCSPAFVLSFLCDWKKKENIILWVTTIVTSIPFLMNYGNGCAQFGMRYSLDFTPYLFLLSCDGMKKMSIWKKVLIVMGILVNLWGSLYWKYYG